MLFKIKNIANAVAPSLPQFLIPSSPKIATMLKATLVRINRTKMDIDELCDKLGKSENVNVKSRMSIIFGHLCPAKDKSITKANWIKTGIANSITGTRMPLCFGSSTI